jgi:hypothetical protein
VFVLATLAFVAGGVATGFLTEQVAAEPQGLPLRPGGFYDTGDGFLYFEEREGLSYRNGVRLQDAAPPRMTVITTARQNPSTSTVTIPATGEQLSLEQFESVYWTRTRPPAGFAGFFAAAAEVSSAWIERAAVNDLNYLALGGITILLFSMAWVVVRLTKWPLLNATLAVVLVWGVVELLALDLPVLAREVLGEMVPEQLYPYVPHALLAVITLVFVIVSLFQAPFREWQRNIAGG